MNKIPYNPESGTVSQRLTRLRKATGLTHEEIEKKYGITILTLRSWEAGQGEMTLTKARILVFLYKDYGIDCTVEWIMHGTGPAPLKCFTLTP